jgi:hypothetical protein
MAAALALMTKYRLTINDPMDLPAGLTGMDAHQVFMSELEFYRNNIATFYTANANSRANATVLYIQARGILQNDPKAGDYFNSLLKQLFSPKQMQDLDNFKWGICVKDDLEMRGKLLSDENGKIPDISNLFYPVNNQ